MKKRSAHERELGSLIIAANSGEASDEQLARLDELVRSDRALAHLAAELLDQQAALAWQGSLRGEMQEPSACEVMAADLATAVSVAHHEERESLATRRRWLWPTIAVSLGFLLGGLSVWFIDRDARRDAAVLQQANSGQLVNTIEIGEIKATTLPAYEAKLIHSTACLWEGSAMNSLPIGSGLASGESLHLLEGLAEFTLTWIGRGQATVSLEGPAAMMLTTEGMPTLRFGRLSATISAVSRPFVLETPVGRLTLPESGAFGVSAYGNEGEVHVFSGIATFEPAWRSPEQTAPLTIDAGHSIRIQAGEDGEPQITWHAADNEYFAAQLSMNSDGLVVSPAYVSAVLRDKPIGYWRFERDDWPEVPNLIGNDLTCHTGGKLARVQYQGNQVLEFGTNDKGAEILSDKLLTDSFDKGYSVEFWVKPSHYHLGSVVSLVGDTPAEGGKLPHGMLVELGGTGRIPTAIHHPGCIRFLHRSPAGALAGTSCYSKTPYTLRKWQHVVATKNGSAMRLYINGEVVAEGQDPRPLPSGLRLLVGSLYPSSSERPYNGQLDELALYNRPLSEQEVNEHYQLVRPVPSKPATHIDWTPRTAVSRPSI